MNDRRANFARLAPQRAQFADQAPDRRVDFGRRRGEGHAGDRFPRREREKRRLRHEPMQRRVGIEQILPVLPIRPAMDLDQQSPPQAGDPDRGGQMVDGRGREDGQPDRLEAGRFLHIQSRDRPVELHGLQEPEPMARQRGQALKAVRRLRLVQRGAQIAAEIGRGRQPAHGRTSGGGAIQHKNDPNG